MANTDFITLGHEEAGRASFPHIFKAQEKDDGGESYTVSLLFDKDSPALPKLKKLASAAKQAEYGDNVPGKLVSPFRDGDEKYEDDPEKYHMYQGKTYVTFSSQYKPKVYDLDTSEIMAVNMDSFYPGCHAVVHCNAYTWVYKHPQSGKIMKRGIGFGFDAIQKVKDDERFGGGGGVSSAEDAGFTSAGSGDASNYESSDDGDDW